MVTDICKSMTRRGAKNAEALFPQIPNISFKSSKDALDRYYGFLPTEAPLTLLCFYTKTESNISVFVKVCKLIRTKTAVIDNAIEYG